MTMGINMAISLYLDDQIYRLTGGKNRTISIVCTQGANSTLSLWDVLTL